MNTTRRHIGRSKVRGLSLIEVMISLVIGLVVVGAVLVSYIGSGQTNKRQAAYAEMNENAQIAFSILRRELLLAGYAQPNGTQTVAGVTTFARTYAQRPIFGCDVGFNDYGAATGAICKAGTAEKPAIEISYEADVSNTVPIDVAGVATPSDCLGAALPALAASGVQYNLTRNRYYVFTGSTGRSELHCKSALGNTAQPLVDNVDDLQFWYGEAGAVGSRQIARYVTAANVTDWQNILSVRVCLLMRSSETVLNSEDTTAGTTNYLDCNSNTTPSTDGYVRRAYLMTTALRNKMIF